MRNDHESANEKDGLSSSSFGQPGRRNNNTSKHMRQRYCWRRAAAEGSRQACTTKKNAEAKGQTEKEISRRGFSAELRIAVQPLSRVVSLIQTSE
jgi:hypothetical protein